MEVTRETVAGIIGGAVAVLLQIALAPSIALAAAVPNFIVVFCVVRAVACPDHAGLLLPFILGLVFDLVGGGPVGAMALVLVLVTFLASRAYLVLNNDTLFMPAAILLASTMLVEVLYGIIVVACGATIMYRVLPCMLYDCVIGLLFYPIAIRVLVSRPLGQPGTPQLR